MGDEQRRDRRVSSCVPRTALIIVGGINCRVLRTKLIIGGGMGSVTKASIGHKGEHMASSFTPFRLCSSLFCHFADHVGPTKYYSC